MDIIQIVILILLFSVISVPVSNRLRIPLEVFLVIGSCIIGMMLRVPDLNINPVIVFNVFLPIILFYAAYFSSLIDFKIYRSPILLLSVGLVIFTMAVVACLTKLLLPMLSWPECFLLGAIISPTDASAATSIIKKMNAPKYLITLLEAESLFNDATALILFRFALVASATASFSLSQTVTQFAFVSIGGAALGMLAGWIALCLLLRVGSSVAITTLTFVTAIGTYIIGEYLNVSSVVATVVSGIYFGIKLPELNTSASRVQGRASWDTLIFIINCLAFTLIGLELPVIIKDMPLISAGNLVLAGMLISAGIIAARMLWVFATSFATYQSRADMPKKSILFLLGWSGMRGIVSLAAVLSIPTLIMPGESIPHLDTILFVTYMVIAVTLILPSLTLPYLIKKFDLAESESRERQEALARLNVLSKLNIDIDKIAKSNKVTGKFVEYYKQKIQSKISMIQTQLDNNSFDLLSTDYHQLQNITLASIEDEKRILLNMRKTGEIQEEIFNKLFDELDREEIHAQSIRL